MLRAAADASPADWLAHSAGGEYTVHAMVPDAFPAYARVFHPAGLCDRDVRWADVARDNGRTMHAAAEWGSIVGSWQLRGQDGLWDREPDVGQTPERLAVRLAHILAAHTTAPERCWFAVWEGWGVPLQTLWLQKETLTAERLRELEEARSAAEELDHAWDMQVHGAPRFELPSRGMHLLEARLEDIGLFYDGHANAPSIWWPDDRAWCVGSDVDLMTTYLGASRAAVDAVVGDPELEALAILAGQSVTWEADDVNPLPAPPSF
jgi:hypothetical protein